MVALASNSACAERCSVGCHTRDAGSAACVVHAPLTCGVCLAQWSGYSRHNALILAQAVPCSHRAVHTAGSALELKGGNGTAAYSLKSSATAIGGVLAQQLPFIIATLGMRARPPRLPRAAPSLYGGNPQETHTAEEDAAEEDAAEEEEDEDDDDEEEEEEQEEEEGDADGGGDGDAIKSRKRKTADTVQRRKLELRPKNTEKAYGSNDYSKGPKREWFLFCKAKPGETIFGVVMDEQKPVSGAGRRPQAADPASSKVRKRRCLGRGGTDGLFSSIQIDQSMQNWQVSGCSAYWFRCIPNRLGCIATFSDLKSAEIMRRTHTLFSAYKREWREPERQHRQHRQHRWHRQLSTPPLP